MDQGLKIVEASTGDEALKAFLVHPEIGVVFTDVTHGWAVGWSDTILATTHGGLNWMAQSSGVACDLHGIAFSHATSGWAVGEDGTILVTANGGE